MFRNIESEDHIKTIDLNDSPINSVNKTPNQTNKSIDVSIKTYISINYLLINTN